MRFRPLALLSAAVVSFASLSAHADSYLYAVSTNFSNFQVSGTITTDSNFGLLDVSDITDLDLTLSGSTLSDTLAYQSSDIEMSGFGLSAAPDGLTFDYDAPGANFLIQNLSTGTYVCFQTNGCDDYSGAHESISIAGNPALVQQQSGAVSIATFVPPAETPEPSTLVLLGTGSVAAAGLAKWRLRVV